MNRQNTEKLLNRFAFVPRKDPLFRKDISMPMSFDCGDGWFDLLWKLFEDIEEALGSETEEFRSGFSIDQVKEKYAGLRVYTSYENDSISTLVDRAEYDSYHTCEACGKPGKPRSGGWFRTLCDEHAAERDQVKEWKLTWEKDYLIRIGRREEETGCTSTSAVTRAKS